MAATTFNIHQAKTHLSRLIARAVNGEEIVIAKAEIPKVRLTPVRDEVVTRRPGRFAGDLHVAEAFFEPLPPETLASWETRREILP
jgi:prevent-host-death family protein